MRKLALVVLISGSGSNLQALIDAIAAGELPATIRAVVSNRSDAYGLRRAAEAGIPTHIVDHREYGNARAFGQALRERIDPYAPELVVLAGFMRILDPEFVACYRGRVINLHPSLLPRYPGLHTHRRVLENGDRDHGASVHFVTEELDAGPVIIQGRVAVSSSDTVDSLAEKVHAVEHRILPTAVRWIAEGRTSLAEGRVLLDGRVSPEQGLSVDHNSTQTSTPVIS